MSLEEDSVPRAVEAGFRRTLQQYEAILSTTQDGFCLLDYGGRWIDVNAAYCSLVGFSRADLLGRSIRELEPEGEAAEVRRRVRGAIEKGADRFETRQLTKSDQIIDVDVSIAFLREQKLFVVFVRDITERKRTESTLREHEKRLKHLASELSLAEERERRRIATELHDGVGQALTFAKIRLGGLQASCNEDSCRAKAEELRDLLDKAIQDTRSLTFELSSPILYQFGLEPALERLVEQMSGRAELAGTFEDDGAEKPLDEDVMVLLYQASREVLLNVAKHAGASAVAVTTRRVDREIRVAVRDDGVGFPAHVATRGSGTEGFGLFSIRERISQLGGRLTIETSPIGGGLVTLAAPLKVDAQLGEQ